MRPSATLLRSHLANRSGLRRRVEIAPALRRPSGTSRVVFVNLLTGDFDSKIHPDGFRHVSGVP
jgi:hypothetical protein